MLETFKIFVIFTMSVTLWTVFLLLKDKRGHASLNRWFSAFLALLAIPQLDTYLGLTFQQPSYLVYVSIYSFLWLKGPFAWGFVSVLTDKKINWKTIWLHFIPWLVIFIAIWNLPYIAPQTQIFGLCHILIYLSLAVVTLMRNRKYIQSLWHGFQNSAFYWLLYIIFGLILLMGIDLIVISMVRLGLLKTYSLLDFFAFPLFSIYVLSIAILSVYRPEILFRKFTEDESNSTNSTQILTSTSNLETILQQGSEQKERYLELDPSLAQPLFNRLNQLMQEQQLYRNNELSLMDLASALKISVHQVSELLNVHQGVNFYLFVNTYRVQFACKLLKDPNCYLRVLDIAFDAGFNNKNSFYRAFKEITGITPHQYKNEYLEATTT